MKRVLLLGALALGAVLVTFAAVSFLTKDSRPEPIEPLVTGSPDPAIGKVKAQYVDALKQAKEWQSNATLARVYRRFDGTLGPAEPTPLVFSFSSLADPTVSFEVVFQGNDVSSRKPEKQSFELAFNPVDVSQWQVDPDNALKIVEDAGGRTFREAHLAGYTLLQQLSQSGTHPLQWYFRYDTGDGSNLRYEAYVNAETGAIDLQREAPRP